MVRVKNDRLSAEISLLGFGAMRLALKGDGSIDYAVNGEMVDKAVAGGVNYFDTAYVYHGQASEVFLGDTLVSRYPRDSFYVATKLPSFLVNKAEDMERMLDESLKRLKTDYIDFYLMHSLDWAAWDKLKSFGAEGFIDRAKRSGKIRRAGFSSHATAAEFQKILDDYPEWEFTQIQLNYADWETSPDIRGSFEIAERAGIPVAIMEPVRGGCLADPDAPPVKRIGALLKPGVTPASIALRWAAEHKAAYVVLSGMSTVAQVEENLATFSPAEPLSSEERAAIAEAVSLMKSFPTIPCTACGYCLDGCPAKIPIDEYFDAYNDYLYYNNARSFHWLSSRGGGAPSDCVGCGVCASVCPQHIEIPQELKRLDGLIQGIKAR